MSGPGGFALPARDDDARDPGLPAGPRRSVEIAASTRRRPSRLGPAPLDEIGIAGLSRSRVAWFLAILLTGWVAAGFVGQAGDTARASERAAAVRAENAALEHEVASLRAEVSLVSEPRWIAQQARSYGIGAAREIPFVLAPGAPPLPADGPGSAARRLGTGTVTRAPLETWLDILFGAHE